MKVSVIVPVYNVEKYILPCLASIREQTLEDFECLIIDDGSKDQSIALAEDFIKDDPRFRIFHKPNGGLSDARNYGLDLALGDYLCFVDSDDTIERDMLEKTVANAEQYDSDIVCFDLSYVYEDGRKERSRGGDFTVTSFAENRDLLYVNNSANNKLYRTPFMRGKYFLKGMWYEDLASVPLWLIEAGRVSYVPEAFYNYLQRSGSISHSGDPRIFDIYKAIHHLEEEGHLSKEDVEELYIRHGLVATTLRIREFEDKKQREEYYRKNVECLNDYCPDWYEAMKKRDFSFKHRIVFSLLKRGSYSFLNRIY